MKRNYILLLCLVLTNSVRSQTLTPQLDTLLRNTLDSMHQVLNNKSLSAAIQLNDSTSWSYATGISELSPLVNVTTDHVYEVGSVTKTMTSAAVLELVDQGILHLDDSLYHWLPTMNYIDSNITIRQLLRHQSGLYDVLANPVNQPTLLNDISKIWTPQEVIDTFLLAPLAAPGGTWNYCNTNYFLLAMIIKAATGQEYHQFIRTNFFTPLQLNSIAVPAFEPLTSPVAHVWIDLNGDNILDDAHWLYYNWLSLNSTVGAAGGYYSTAKDISKWMRTYMRGDLHSNTIMQEAQTTISAPGLPGATYGLGLMKKTFLGLQGYGHGGDLSYSSSSWYFPARDISITVLNNDSKKISWDLVSTVNALLKTYMSWMLSTELDPIDLQQNDCMIYPNPANDKLFLKFHSNESESSQVLIATMFGQIVHRQQLNMLNSDHTYPVQISHLKDGMYVLQLSNTHSTMQKKFTINRHN